MLWIKVWYTSYFGKYIQRKSKFVIILTFFEISHSTEFIMAVFSSVNAYKSPHHICLQLNHSSLCIQITIRSSTDRIKVEIILLLIIIKTFINYRMLKTNWLFFILVTSCIDVYICQCSTVYMYERYHLAVQPQWKCIPPPYPTKIILQFEFRQCGRHMICFL